MKNLIERIEARLDDWGAKLEKKNIEYPVDLICGILFLVIGIVLLLIILCLFAIGCVMDAFAAMYVFTPVFYPLATAVGIDPIHFGIIFCLMLTIGLITPPVGMLLFVTSNISGVPLAKLSKTIWPFVLTAMVVVLLLAFVPDLVMFIPNLFAANG